MALRRQEIRQEIAIAMQNYAAAIRWVQGSTKNRAFTSGNATVPTAPTAAMNLNIGACKLTAKSSGIFRFGFASSCTGMTAADTVDYQVTSYTKATDMALTNSAQVGPGFTTGALGTSGAFVSNAAAGITFTGSGSLVQFDTGTLVQGTAATSVEVAWTGIIHNSITATVETGFTVGNEVLVVVSCNRSAHTQAWATASFSMFLEELGA